MVKNNPKRNINVLRRYHYKTDLEDVWVKILNSILYLNCVHMYVPPDAADNLYNLFYEKSDPCFLGTNKSVLVVGEFNLFNYSFTARQQYEQFMELHNLNQFYTTLNSKDRIPIWFCQIYYSL